MTENGDKAIGIVANPASGKDIRRMIAYGNSVGNSDKVNIVQRIIMGLSVTGIDTVYYMQEYYGIVERALDGIYSEHRQLIRDIRFVPVDMVVLGIELDTVIASEMMADAGVKCIVTLGGDGTNRAVSKGCGNIPLIPISTGTNNVFPKMIEGTIAGMAAGIFASGRLEKDGHILSTKRVELLRNGEMFDVALIDAVVLDNQQIASRAMWKTDSFSQVFLSSCTPVSIGISSIGGQLQEVNEHDDYGLYIKISGNGRLLNFPLAPGLIGSVGIDSHRMLRIGETVPVEIQNGVIAVDGEREISVQPGSEISVKLTWDGPKLLNVEKILADARDEKFFFAQ